MGHSWGFYAYNYGISYRLTNPPLQRRVSVAYRDFLRILAVRHVVEPLVLKRGRGARARGVGSCLKTSGYLRMQCHVLKK